MAEKIFTSAELYEAWPVLSLEERVEGFEFLKRDDADDFFLQLNARDRAELLLALPPGERRLWMRLLAPDDAADVIQEAPAEERESMLSLLDDQTRREVKGLLDYAEDEAGGLMNTRYSRLRADMTVDTEDRVFNAISATAFLMVRNAGVQGVQIDVVELYMKTTTNGAAGRFQMTRADAEALNSKTMSQQDYFVRKVIY